MKVTTMSYDQFLVNSPENFTGTYFADTVDGLEHDSVYRFLKNSRLTPALLDGCCRVQPERPRLV
jgi:hypothetical protein